jgi:type III secretory pathway component EscS
MTLPVTLALAAVALCLTVLFGWQGARPAKPMASPRLTPWRLMMLMSFAVMVAALVHVVGLLRGI